MELIKLSDRLWLQKAAMSNVFHQNMKQMVPPIIRLKKGWSVGLSLNQ